MNFEAQQIPYEALKKVGLEKKDILGMPPDELKGLLSGRPSSLLTLNRDGEKVPAKIALQPENDGSVGVRIYDVKKEVTPPEGFTKADAERLKKGENVVAPYESKNEVVEPYMFKVDQETNQVMKVRVDSIKIPDQLDGATLSSQQKQDLLKGKEVEVVREDGTSSKVALDINESKGYRSEPLNRKADQNVNEQDDGNVASKGRDKKKEGEENKEVTSIGADATPEKKGRSTKEEVKAKVAAGLIAGPTGMIVEEGVQQLKRSFKR